MLTDSPLHESVASTILASAVGPHGRLTLPHLIRLFQEAAMRNTDRMGISSQRLMADHGLTWVLHRQIITALRWPELGEKVTAITAPVRIDRGLVTYRDFHLLGENGTNLIDSTSSWSVMEIHSRRLHRIPAIVTGLLRELPPPEDHLSWPGGKPTSPEVVTAKKSFRVHFADLDFNNHLTNPAFAQLMLEPLGVEKLSRGKLTRADIAYFHEARYGEALVARSGPVANSETDVMHDLRRGEKLLATMLTRWE